RSAFSRRSFLGGAATIGTAAAKARIRRAAGGARGARGELRAAPGTTSAAIVQPDPPCRARGGLQSPPPAAPGKGRHGEDTLPGLLYNGSYIPPMLRCQLGDTLQITLKNDLRDQPTNLHFHGMAVSPQGNSDNVFIHVHPGEQFDYSVHVPANGRQGPGFFWYHPHAHGVVDKQILGGMSGALVVDGFERLFPIVGDLPERFFLLKHVEGCEDNEIVSI